MFVDPLADAEQQAALLASMDPSTPAFRVTLKAFLASMTQAAEQARGYHARMQRLHALVRAISITALDERSHSWRG
jgi:hypothetical protein